MNDTESHSEYPRQRIRIEDLKNAREKLKDTYEPSLDAMVQKIVDDDINFMVANGLDRPSRWIIFYEYSKWVAKEFAINRKINIKY